MQHWELSASRLASIFICNLTSLLFCCMFAGAVITLINVQVDSLGSRVAVCVCVLCACCLLICIFLSFEGMNCEFRHLPRQTLHETKQGKDNSNATLERRQRENKPTNNAEANCVHLYNSQKAAHGCGADTWLLYRTLVTESRCCVSYTQRVHWQCKLLQTQAVGGILSSPLLHSIKSNINEDTLQIEHLNL